MEPSHLVEMVEMAKKSIGSKFRKTNLLIIIGVVVTVLFIFYSPTSIQFSDINQVTLQTRS